MTAKTKAKRASGSTVKNDAAAAAGAATDARANAAGLDDPAADAAEDGQGDTPEESVDGSEGVDDASIADADSADAADSDDAEHEGASFGENDEAASNDAEGRDEDAPNDGGNDDDGEDASPTPVDVEATDDKANARASDNDTSQPAKGLPDGWTLRRVPRKCGQKTDPYWFSPGMSYKFSSLPQVRRFLDCLASAGGDEAAAYDSYTAMRSKKQKRRVESAAGDGVEAEELWDLKVVLAPKQILMPRPILCQGDNCDLVACCIWSSNLDPETPWYSCLDCQEEFFGGWPTNPGELPIKVLDVEWRNAMIEKCTLVDEPAMPNLPSSRARAAKDVEWAASAEGGKSHDDDDADADADAPVRSGDGSDREIESPSDNDDDDDDEQGGGILWELTKIYNANDLRRAKPTMCSAEDCDLVACSRWESNEGEKWFSCLDCQESDYGGWPMNDELPVDFLSEDNRKLIAEKCSAEETPAMPNIPASMSLLSTAEEDGNENSVPAITPPPSHSRAVVHNQSEVVVGAVHGKKRARDKEDGVTPSPMPPKGAKQAAPGKLIDAAATAKNPAVEKPKVISKSAIEAHRKWQAEAEKLGGPDARVVVSKPDAKKLIFDKLHNEFAPMNIDGVFKKLKAVVPSIVLKSCLDEMVDKHMSNPFGEGSDDDEDDDGKPSKKQTINKPTENSDEYSASLKLKEGRNVQNNLYYVDHTKLSNEGNGLLPEVRNELLCDMHKSKADVDQLSRQLKSIAAEAVQLESEPKNEELILEVAELEKKLGEMNDSLEESRAHASNEKHVQKVRKEIDNLASVWRKRKRQCIEFISIMEESTEGTISLKKCLKGEGALEIDSDEAAIGGAIAFAKRKRPTVSRGSLAAGGKRGDESTGVRPDENFIGVQLSAQGRPERVFMPGE